MCWGSAGRATGASPALSNWEGTTLENTVSVERDKLLSRCLRHSPALPQGHIQGPHPCPELEALGMDITNTGRAGNPVMSPGLAAAHTRIWAPHHGAPSLKEGTGRGNLVK